MHQKQSLLSWRWSSPTGGRQRRRHLAGRKWQQLPLRNNNNKANSRHPDNNNHCAPHHLPRRQARATTMHRPSISTPMATTTSARNKHNVPSKHWRQTATLPFRQYGERSSPASVASPFPACSLQRRLLLCALRPHLQPRLNQLRLHPPGRAPRSLCIYAASPISIPTRTRSKSGQKPAG